MESLTVDAFTMELLAPTTMRVTWKGQGTPASIQAMHRYAMDCHAALGQGVMTGCIVDASEATGLTRDGRRSLTDLGWEKPWQHVVFFGVRSELKVLLELMRKALVLMKADVANIAFADTQAEARAWLAGQ